MFKFLIYTGVFILTHAGFGAVRIKTRTDSLYILNEFGITDEDHTALKKVHRKMQRLEISKCHGISSFLPAYNRGLETVSFDGTIPSKCALE